MERDSNDPKIEFKQIGGLNQRPSPNNLPAPQMSQLHGVYPSRDGWMERLPGTDFILSLGVPIWSMAQLDDGTGNIAVQTADGTERIITLAEIFGRAGDTSDLTVGGPLPDDAFNSALIVHDEVQGTDGGAIGAALNTWYGWKLTANPVNEGTIVTTFRDYTAGANPSTFDLAAGTYRVEAYATVLFSYNYLNADLRTCTITVASPAVVSNTAHGLSINDAFKFATTGTMPAGAVAGTQYYVIAAGFGANSFQFSATLGGAAINTTVAATGTIYLQPVAKDESAVAAIYNETDSTVAGVFMPVVCRNSNASLGGNPNFPQTRQSSMHCALRFTITGTKRFSIQAAGASASGTVWTANADARGKTHGVTTALGAGAVDNRFLAVKITKEA